MKKKYLHVVLVYTNGWKSYLAPTRDFLSRIKKNEKEVLEAREFSSQKKALEYMNMRDVLPY